MSGRTSAEMLEARKLLREGYTAANAARETGLNQSTISRCKVCQQIIKEVKEAKGQQDNQENKPCLS